MPDDRTLGQVLHEARRAAGEQRPRPWPIEDWKDRGPQLQAVDEAMAAAVEAVVRKRVAAEQRERASRRWPPSFNRDELFMAAAAVVQGEPATGQEPS